MDEYSVHEPFLQSGGVQTVYVRKTPLLLSSVKWVLKFVMWVLFISWIALMFLYPSDFGNQLVDNWTDATDGTVFGETGSIFFVFSGPIIVIAFLSIPLLIITEKEDLPRKKTSKNPRFRLWTFPVLVDGPFGVVSAAEFVGILLFVVFVIWGVYSYTMTNIRLLSEDHVPSEDKCPFMLQMTGLRFGTIGLLCFAFLLLPVSRGSVLLRLIDIPFEHATRYHIWLGHLTMLLFTLHGICYLIEWSIQGRLLEELLQWNNDGFANLPGVISLLAGLMMWMTSLYPVRKQCFELFFYTHQLYVVFVVFLAFHVGEIFFSMAAGGIFIFLLDRFLRFCQSRRTVDVLSAECLPGETVELVLSKPANLRYNALSFVFLQIHEISWLQWHPFSVSSSPLDGKYHISVLTKVLGQWTEKLRENILRISEAEPQEGLSPRSHTKLTASVEGPYGHELPYHLMYENLILVAGGIGISPFLAILSDILHHITEGKPYPPKNVLIVWAVKKSIELPLLRSFDMESICPFFSNELNLEIFIYVTRESGPPLEEGQVHKAVKSCDYPATNGCGMSVLVGTGDNIWAGLYVISSAIGFTILVALLDIFYITRFSIEWWWYKGFLFIALMVASVIMFGGSVIGLWHLWGKRISSMDEKIEVETSQSVDTTAHEDLEPKNPNCSTVILYGSRPDFKEIFESVSTKWGNVDVGVIVCGPPTLQSTVAKEIRSHSLRRESHHPIFHFNSHSFDL